MRKTLVFLIYRLCIIGSLMACGSIDVLAGESLAPNKASVTKSMQINLEASSGRTIPLTLYMPKQGCQSCSLIFFSHGAFSAPERYELLLTQWAKQGYLIAAPLHVDSELHPKRDDFSDRDWARTRVEDYETVVNSMLQEPLALDNVDLSGELIVAGHSFGALIAQIGAGAKLDDVLGVALTNQKINPLAVIAISPPGAMPNYMSADGWAAIQKPMLVVTGTADVIPNFTPEWEMHLDSYKAAPEGMAYALVFEDIDHYFNGAFGRPRGEDFEENQQVVLLNQMVVEFIRQIENDQQPSPGQWRLRSASGVEALSR